MTLIGLLVMLVIVCLLFWAVRTLMAAFGVPAQIQTVVHVLFVVIVVLWLLGQLGVLPAGPVLRLR